ncbi:MAG: hypothetical protein IJV03_02200 [Alphaproteobacteria bacterium]|nr:hypothetical protein [Alphaproteobacteria bacterium]
MNLECKVLPGIGCAISTKEHIGQQYITMTKKFIADKNKGYLPEKTAENYKRIIADKRIYFPDFIKGRIEDLQIKVGCSSENREKNKIALNFWLKKLQEYTK